MQRQPSRARRRPGIAAVFVFSCILGAASASAAAENDGQGWFLVTARGPIGHDWKLYLEAQPRIDGDGMRQLILRPAVGYQLTRAWSLWQGYGWTPSFDPFKGENRLFQQSLVETPRGTLPFALTNRTRLEQRWIEGVSGVSVRVRHMLRAVYPLAAQERWALVGYDEPFVTLNDTGSGPVSGFDQNRVFLGVNHLLAAGTRVEVGYLNQVLNGRAGAADTLRHVGLLWLDYQW
jgi:hypothetical protein